MSGCTIESWLENQPCLAFRLLAADHVCYHFPKIRVSIQPGTEILFVDGVVRLFDSVKEFLECGGKIVFVEEKINKIKAFLALSDFLPHPNIAILSPVESMRPYAFKKGQFIGKLNGVKRQIQEIHMALSEYQNLGREILENVQMNLLHTDQFIHGKYLEGRFKGKRVVVCGSGPSLSYDALRKLPDDVAIFAAGSSVVKLLEWGIRIDAAFAVDPFAVYPEFADQTFPLFYQNRLNHEFFRLHKGPKIWMGSAGGWPIEEWIYKQLGLDPFFFDAGWNAGLFAVHVVDYLGCEVTLLGLDESEKWIERRSYTGFHSLRPMERLDLEKVRCIIEAINQPRPHWDEFLSQRLHPTLLDVENIGDPVHDHLIEPLWNVFDGLYGEGMIAKALFAKRVLRFQQTFRFYPSHKLHAKETTDGRSYLFYETGEVKAEVDFVKGKQEGKFVLYAKNGVKLREGAQIIRREDGETICTR